ncbi:hypothetical protein N7516_003705 [Penicillium verrucosum]|uniref:uncharacterized protein n=1 Tax=Penicillium verrucosum TaxID=60171 RepID=UPI00254560A2|nr:uncharacterized protein N7516_003705 [Penicillium verrucosum]KAJ5943537.1 hypothetical protein N7516_003705 [Penicillium verrucosum]
MTNPAKECEILKFSLKQQGTQFLYIYYQDVQNTQNVILLVTSVPHHSLPIASDMRGSANTGPNRLSGRITAMIDCPPPRNIGPEPTQCQALALGMLIWGAR